VQNPDRPPHQISRHLCARRSEVIIGNDVVSVEYVASPMATDAIAIFSGIPARTILRTALRRRSWNSCPSSFALSQADRHAFIKRTESLSASVVEDPLQVGVTVVAVPEPERHPRRGNIVEGLTWEEERPPLMGPLQARHAGNVFRRREMKLLIPQRNAVFHQPAPNLSISPRRATTTRHLKR